MFFLFNLYDITQGIPPHSLVPVLSSLGDLAKKNIVMVYKDQGPHKLWKITKKSSIHGKSWNLKKKILNNHGKIMEFCEII